MKVIVTTPYARESLQGNTIAAKRLVSILRDAGLDASVVSKGESVGKADVLIALHARKSAHFIDDFLVSSPRGKVIVYLTGTDLYDEIPSGCGICVHSMERADALTVSQEASLKSVPAKYRSKAVVAHKSIELPKDFSQELVADEGGSKLFICVGHLRAVKQPFMAVEALQGLDESVRLVLLGDAVDEVSGGVARRWQSEDARFEWLGGLSHVEALKWMQRSLVTINTSLVEGGANSVGESIVLGVPVLASKIEGNVGMLGEDYGGYFGVDSKEELADLMRRVLHDEDFLETLLKQVKARGEFFLRENEMRDWMKLLESIV
jgi:glycosyltransferase involved in cell wall biosynthesis